MLRTSFDRQLGCTLLLPLLTEFASRYVDLYELLVGRTDSGIYAILETSSDPPTKTIAGSRIDDIGMPIKQPYPSRALS